MRLGLVIYLARFMSIDEVGLFGLIQGAAGLTPIVLGWGVTYFLGRELVGRPGLEAGRLVRDRLLLTIASLAAGGAIAGALAGRFAAPEALIYVAAIIFLEAIAFDVHIALISIGMPLVANILLFLRSGLWVIPAAGLGMLFPGLRTLDFVLLCWISALFLNYLALYLFVRRWPLKQIARSSIDLSWIRMRVRRAWLIYINDLGLVSMTYLDRYIVNSMLDLRATGIFILNWSIANAIHVLVTAATVQVSLPLLVSAFKEGGDRQWGIVLRGMVLRVLAIGSPLALLAYVAAVYCLPLVLATDSVIDGTLLAWMLLATVIRLLSDALNYGLYSRGLDRSLALINIGGALSAVVLGLVLIHLLGLVGVGIAMALTSTLLLVARTRVLYFGDRSDP